MLYLSLFVLRGNRPRSLRTVPQRGEKRTRDTRLLSTNSPPASSCIWAASHAKRQPVPSSCLSASGERPFNRTCVTGLKKRDKASKHTEQTPSRSPFPTFFFFFKFASPLTLLQSPHPFHIFCYYCHVFFFCFFFLFVGRAHPAQHLVTFPSQSQ